MVVVGGVGDAVAVAIAVVAVAAAVAEAAAATTAHAADVPVMLYCSVVLILPNGRRNP